MGQAQVLAKETPAARAEQYKVLLEFAKRFEVDTAVKRVLDQYLPLGR